MSNSWRRLISSISSVDSELPYNWNWQRRWTEADKFLEANPILLMDVGARGSAPPEFESMRRHVRRIGFEPDPEECRNLNAGDQGTFFPTLIADQPGHQTLHLYRDRGISSVLNLSERYQRLWIGEMPVDATYESVAITIDGFLSEHFELSPDFLKLDTQGSELAILRGAKDALRRIGLVEVEVEFVEMYEGQPLFVDVVQLMTNEGFELLYLNRVFATRKQIYRGPSRGQLVFADALFGKREDRTEDLTLEQLAKYAILLCQYGHVDIACQLTQESPKILEIVPGLNSVFRRRANLFSRAVSMQFDKLLSLGLHLRRYNQRGTDSDRSWPIR